MVTLLLMVLDIGKICKKSNNSIWGHLLGGEGLVEDDDQIF